MNHLLERLGRIRGPAALDRDHLVGDHPGGGPLAASQKWGGTYVNNYTVSGSDSEGLNLLTDVPAAGRDRRADRLPRPERHGRGPADRRQ